VRCGFCCSGPCVTDYVPSRRIIFRVKVPGVLVQLPDQQMEGLFDVTLGRQIFAYTMVTETDSTAGSGRLVGSDGTRTH
jgi:hypothetical protein